MARSRSQLALSVRAEAPGPREWPMSPPTSVLASGSRVSVFGNIQLIPDLKETPPLSFTGSVCPSPDRAWNPLRSQSFQTKQEVPSRVLSCPL